MPPSRTSTAAVKKKQKHLALRSFPSHQFADVAKGVKRELVCCFLFSTKTGSKDNIQSVQQHTQHWQTRSLMLTCQHISSAGIWWSSCPGHLSEETARIFNKKLPSQNQFIFAISLFVCSFINHSHGGNSHNLYSIECWKCQTFIKNNKLTSHKNINCINKFHKYVWYCWCDIKWQIVSNFWFLFLIHWCLLSAPAWILNVKEEGNIVLPLACCCLIKTNFIPKKNCFQELWNRGSHFMVWSFKSLFDLAPTDLLSSRTTKLRWNQFKAIEIGRRHRHGDFKQQNDLGHSEHFQTTAGCLRNLGPAIHRLAAGGKLSQTPETPAGTVATR